VFHSLAEFLGCFLELLGGCEEFSKFVVRQRIIWPELNGLPKGVFSFAGFIRARRMPRWQCKRALFGCRVIARRRHRSASPILPRFANAMASRNRALAELGLSSTARARLRADSS